MKVAFGVTKLMGRWTLWPQTGTLEFVIAGLSLQVLQRGGGRDVASWREVGGSENRALGCHTWMGRTGGPRS